MKYRKWLALLAAAALSLALLAGCGGQGDPASPDPAPAGNEETEPPVSDPGPGPGEDSAEPAGAGPEESGPNETVEVPPEDPAPDPAESPETAEPAGDPAPEPEADPEPEPQPEPEAVPEDGSYTASVTLGGGTGRATVESPAALRCENGQFWATIVWSSPNYDYMKVGGETYLQTNTEGNSTFEIPVAAFDQALDVIADTVAMSEPHEIEYTLYFDSATLQKQ